MTALILVSRLTGFVRTWAMGAALGLSLLSSSYQIAYNLPSMLYELVIGGMLITAFLPVYLEVRRERGVAASNEYVGNLLGILLLVLGAASVVATIGAPAVIWTQSFMSADTGQMDTAIYLFRFFAIEILFYGLGSVFSGVLNAHRDYFWSNFAPVLDVYKRQSLKSAWQSLKPTTSFLRRSGWNSGRATISKCWRPWVSRRVLKTTRAILMAESPASPPSPSSTTSPRTCSAS